MQVILADNQAIFRTGMARVLMAESDIHVAVECGNLERLQKAVRDVRGSVVIFPSSITVDLQELVDLVQQAGSRSVMILEHDAELDDVISRRLEAVILRSVVQQQLVDCLHRVASGERYMQQAIVKVMPSSDHIGAKVLRRLTSKELQIVALLSGGCKNKDIAIQLGTKEQVVKNSLRRIYGKTGVSDRLELALFTVRHKALAEVVEATRLALFHTA